MTTPSPTPGFLAIGPNHSQPSLGPAPPFSKGVDGARIVFGADKRGLQAAMNCPKKLRERLMQNLLRMRFSLVRDTWHESRMEYVLDSFANLSNCGPRCQGIPGSLGCEMNSRKKGRAVESPCKCDAMLNTRFGCLKSPCTYGCHKFRCFGALGDPNM